MLLTIGVSVKPLKVIGIGLNKTGTKTLAACLRTLGYVKHVSVDKNLLAQYRNGYLCEIFRIIDNNESFEDWPFPLMYKECYFRYGDNARYILTTRKDPHVWLNSLKRHSLRTSPDQHCRLLAYGYNYPHGLEQFHLDFYNRHNGNVVQFFERHNASHLLLKASWDAGDGWNELCTFLDEPIPMSEFPHENKGIISIQESIQEENITRIRQQLRLLSIGEDQVDNYLF